MLKKLNLFGYKKMYRDLFEKDDGRIVLLDLCNRFHMMSSTKKHGDDRDDILIREGQRNVILYILSQLNYDFDKYLKDRENYKLEVTND